MANDQKKDDQLRAGAGRGPAYPFIPLQKAVERAEQLRDANMARLFASPLSIYKVWGWSGDSGNARQTLAALNQFGLVEYEGRGDDRQVGLSDLARRIVLDKVPGSQERAAALREAALSPAIHARLWEEYGPSLPPDVVIETFLVRDNRFNDVGAKNLIGEYRDTFEYARLGEPANVPPEQRGVGPSALDMLMGPVGTKPKGDQMHAPAGQAGALASMEAISENDIKIMLDGDRLRVSAFVDIKGAKRLLRALKANMALLQDEDDEEQDARD